jgi:hypothetical protein
MMGAEVSRRARVSDRLIRDAMADALRARNTPLRPRELYDPGRPRLSYPQPRPVRCGPPSRRDDKQPL